MRVPASALVNYTEVLRGASTVHPYSLDLRCKEGTDIYALGPFEITFVSDNLETRAGRFVDVLYHRSGVKLRLCHLSARLVNKGDKGHGGQIIAKSGNTGNSTTPHLHIQTWKRGVPCDPKEIFQY